MMPRSILRIAFCLAFAACNNSTETKTGTTDSSISKMTSDSSHMDHMNMNAAVPALPDVPAGAKVSFKNLKEGQTVKSPIKVEMAVVNIRIDTAGPVVAGSGHHHLFIDAEDSLAAGTTVPKDANHLHFGKGQVVTDTIRLAPGKHKLTLQMADGLHRSYGGALAKTVHIVVVK
jgi:hypothetical protein